MNIIKELIDALYNGVSPLSKSYQEYTDNGYGHTNITEDLLLILFKEYRISYVVECGSMIGGSAILIINTLNQIYQNDQKNIICIDPFTGGVDMWLENKYLQQSQKWNYLQLENGIPTIYKRFLANCQAANIQTQILPINCTTTVGTKVLKRLYEQGRISELPNCIYLDSAHEENETLCELIAGWNLLSNNSVLFGDDWSWTAVRNDVIKFATMINDSIDTDKVKYLHQLLSGSQVYNNILLYRGQWIICKK